MFTHLSNINVFPFPPLTLCKKIVPVNTQSKKTELGNSKVTK